MADRPIIFSAPMVRALLDGRKGQTRRVLKVQPKLLRGAGPFYRPHPMTDPRHFNALHGSYVACIVDAPYAPGDRLWVREQCATWGRGPEREPVEYPVVYAADDPEWEGIKRDAKMSKGDEWKIRPSIHMPRWASRLTLTVTEVRVQRLQEISEADALAEGCAAYANSTTIDCDTPNPRDDFARLWNSIHGPDAWAANPWVVALTFTVAKGNIDEVAA